MLRPPPKLFQRATIKRALGRLRDDDGSRRFLVADEVGLGKTLTAQGVVAGLLKEHRNLRVFYVCSNLVLANQNQKRLLEMLPESDASQALVEADRPTLLFTNSGKRPKGLRLYTLTPGVLPAEGRKGNVQERALIAVLLREMFPSFGGTFGMYLRGEVVGDERWRTQKAKAEDDVGAQLHSIIPPSRLASPSGLKFRSTLTREHS